MNRRSFYRKIIYLVALVPLLMLLHALGKPATSSVKGAKGSPGGKLAQLRTQYDLSEAQLGEIDPTSVTIKLATLGMRGVAANILWTKANNYKMKKDWTNLSATLRQMTKLEPHFLGVWRFQAWNLSYNVSVEFDDYRERYRWVIKGIDFLDEGIRYNENEARLVWDAGWFTAQKIGRADESKQFRRLFRLDDDFHGSRPVEDRDNWLVGKERFIKAEELVQQGAPLRGMSPVIFHSDVAMCQMNHSEALEADGSFGDKARRSWSKASREWDEYGSRDIPTSMGDIIQLNDREMFEQNVLRIQDQLDALEPGVRERVQQERINNLTQAERELQAAMLEPGDRTEDEYRRISELQRKLTVTHEDVANAMTGANRSRGLELAKQLAETEHLANTIRRYREIVNFEYWRRRAKVEQTAEALAAREFVYNGTFALATGNLPQARELFDAGLAKWREVLDMEQFANLPEDGDLGSELIDAIKVYRRILDARDEEFPDPFILQDILDLHQEDDPDVADLPANPSPA